MNGESAIQAPESKVVQAVPDDAMTRRHGDAETCQLLVASCWLSVINRQLSVVSCPWSVGGAQLCVVGILHLSN
jgi:hypothetical protein